MLYVRLVSASQNSLPSAVVAEQQDDGTGKEVILDDSECPLQIFRDWPADRGNAHTGCHIFFLVLYCPLLLPQYYYNFHSSNLNAQLVYTTVILFLGALVFQLKKRPPDYQGRKGRKVDDKGMKGNSLPPEKLPYLVELSPGTCRTSKHCFLNSPSSLRSLR